MGALFTAASAAAFTVVLTFPGTHGVMGSNQMCE